MFDPATMGAALASLKTIIDLMRNANDAQLTLKISSEIAQVQGKLLDVQQQALTLQVENQQLRDEIRQLKASAEDEKVFQFMHGVYWKTYDVLSLREDENGNRITELHWDGPFCPTCKDADKRPVRLRDLGTYEGQGKFHCDIHHITLYAPRMNE